MSNERLSKSTQRVSRYSRASYDELNRRQYDHDLSLSELTEHALEGEPVTEPHRFGVLDNILLAPHCIGWTDELFRDIWRALCKGMIDLSLGKRPKGVVNPEILDRPSYRRKLDRLSVCT